MITSYGTDKQLEEGDSSPTSSSLLSASSADLQTVSKTPEESYKISLAIFKSLDAEAQKTKFGSQKMKRNSKILDHSNCISIFHDDPEVQRPCPGLRQSFDGNSNYYLRQSLYGTVRMNPSKSFPTVFNSKTLPGVLTLKLDETETETEELEDEENPDTSPNVANLNFFHGKYHQVKDNPSYLSENEEDGCHMAPEDLKCSPKSANDQTSDRVSITSDYDSVSNGSTSTTFNSTESSETNGSTLGFESTNRSSDNNSSETINETTRPCRLIDSSNRSNNTNKQEVAVGCGVDNKTSYLSNFELKADVKKVNSCSENPAIFDEIPQLSNIIDPKSSANFDSLPSLSFAKFSPSANGPGQNNFACHRSKVRRLESGPEVTTSERGEISVRERETLTTIRSKSRSSMICKRREKLKSKAEDVAEEFRQKREVNQGFPGDKLHEVRRTLEDLNFSQTNLSTLVQSKSHLEGIQQSIKVERKEEEVHFVEQLDPTTPTSTTTCNATLTTTRPILGSATKEFSEIYLDVERFHVEINNIVRCETISVKHVLRGTSENIAENQKSENSANDGSIVTPTLQMPSLSSSSSSSSSSSAAAAAETASNIFKVTSVLLIKTTVIDMNSSLERRQVFLEMREEFAREESNGGETCTDIVAGKVGRPGDPGQMARRKLSEEQHAVLFRRMNELSAVETSIV